MSIPTYEVLLSTFLCFPFNERVKLDKRYLTLGNKMARFFHRGAWAVFVSSEENIKQILADTLTFQKFIVSENFPRSAFAKMMGVNVLESNGDIWKRHRKAVSPPFKSQFEPEIFNSLSLQLIEALSESKSPTNIHAYIQRLTIDALGKALLGVDFGSLAEKNSSFVSAYNRFIFEFIKPIYFIFPFLDSPRNPFRRQIFQDLAVVDNYLLEVISQCREVYKENPAEKAHLLSYMFDQEGEFSDKEIRDNIMVFFLAGHDTTSTSLSIALYHLAKYPEVQQKARQEIIRVLGPDASIPPLADDLKNLPYLTAIIKETLRLFPPVTILPERVASKDTVIQGQVIPKGTVVLMHTYLMQRDPDCWDAPDSFRPERFLEPHSKLNRTNSAWSPFGGGTRQCLGMGFSLMEQRVVLSSILRHFAISFPAGHTSDLVLSSCSLISPVGLKLKFSSLKRS
ncbi:hypothetical protein DSO57_1036328 [Entomophthora muscae]|uniref:Uncharacterized protein n=1 Tax=Entomophthora muscae TaxID=34485 RepID=A0ACC2TX60_9FUNG|nr:hypothetical protein DSO57_1036328 [Entomophthora muscae]